MTKVVFFGNERLVSGLEKTEAPTLQGLIDNGYNVVAVVSHHSESSSRNKRPLEVAEIANKHNIPIFLPNKPSEIIEELKNFKADIAVLAAYGRIISQQVIDVFPLGIVNIHPSLLPKYRGPTPIESVILNGDTETGVSIMQLSAGMDEGPVYAQQTTTVSPAETKFELYSRLAHISTELFFEIFPKIIDGSLTPSPQANDKATYSKLIQKTDGVIEWSKSAMQIEREIHAYAGWPQSRTSLNGIDVIITMARAHVGELLSPGALRTNSTRSLDIGTSDGILSIEAVKPLGKKEMPIAAFLAGYGSKLDI